MVADHGCSSWVCFIVAHRGCSSWLLIVVARHGCSSWVRVTVLIVVAHHCCSSWLLITVAHHGCSSSVRGPVAHHGCSSWLLTMAAHRGCPSVCLLHDLRPDGAHKKICACGAPCLHSRVSGGRLADRSYKTTIHVIGGWGVRSQCNGVPPPGNRVSSSCSCRACGRGEAACASERNSLCRR